MTDGMSPRIRDIVSSLAAVATTTLLASVVNSFDPRLLTGPEASGSANAAIAAARRTVPVRRA